MQQANANHVAAAWCVSGMQRATGREAKQPRRGGTGGVPLDRIHHVHERDEAASPTGGAVGMSPAFGLLGPTSSWIARVFHVRANELDPG